MDIRKKLIKDLAKEENLSFLVDLSDILPDVFAEYYIQLFEKKIEFPENWKNYKIVRNNSDNDNINIVHDSFVGDAYFSFSLYIGQGDKNFYYGIRGPWDKSNSIDEVKSLQLKSESMSLIPWKNWMYSYFKSNRDSIFNCIRLEQDINIAFLPFKDEFFNNCNLLKDLLEKSNIAILNSAK